MMASPHRVVGRSYHRVDGVDKVTGAATYAIDLSIPGMAHGVVVRSPIAHGSIRSITSDQAMAMPGVFAVITHDDLDKIDPFFGHIRRDHPVLAPGRVLYYGEPVALVVAETRLHAEEAAAAVVVEYDELEPVLDPVEGLKEVAPLLHRQVSQAEEGFDVSSATLSGNLCAVVELEWGDVERGVATADLLVEGEYRYPMLYGYAMEPYNALAQFAEGQLTVYSTAQHPYQVRRDLSKIFDLPLSRVRVVAPYVGGGYGTKSYTKVEPLAAIGAWATGRPVKVVLSVEESILTTRSDGAIITARTGFRSDGTITVRDFDIVMDSGAYSDNSPQVAQKMANRCFGPYRIPALRVRVRAVFTNTVPASSLRGFGAPQGNLAGELQIDEGAARLDIDPVDLRLRNLVPKGEEILPGKRPLDADLSEDLRMLSRALGWSSTVKGPTGIGFGLSVSDAGAQPVSVSIVRIHSDGSASAAVGATELGQGSHTVLSQIVAEELGLPMERVSIVSSDTANSPFEWTTGASRTTTIVGRSLQAACADALVKMRGLAAEIYEVAEDQVRVTEGRLLVGGNEVAYESIIKAWFGTGGEVVGVGCTRQSGDLAQVPSFWEVGASGVRLSIDPDTGRVSVDALVTVGDVGYAINPSLVHSQDLGAAVMGLGAALFEELVYEGQAPLNANIVDYRVPTFHDVRMRTQQLLCERGDGTGPYGAKGAGEGSLNPIGGAVAAAVGRVVGVFPRRLPLTPERVWRLSRGEES